MQEERVGKRREGEKKRKGETEAKSKTRSPGGTQAIWETHTHTISQICAL